MDSHSENHKLAARLKALSARSPFHNGTLNYDIRFDAHERGYDVFVERTLVERVDPPSGSIGRRCDASTRKTTLGSMDARSA